LLVKAITSMAELPTLGGVYVCMASDPRKGYFLAGQSMHLALATGRLGYHCAVEHGVEFYNTRTTRRMLGSGNSFDACTGPRDHRFVTRTKFPTSAVTGYNIQPADVVICGVPCAAMDGSGILGLQGWADPDVNGKSVPLGAHPLVYGALQGSLTDHILTLAAPPAARLFAGLYSELQLVRNLRINKTKPMLFSELVKELSKSEQFAPYIRKAASLFLDTPAGASWKVNDNLTLPFLFTNSGGIDNVSLGGRGDMIQLPIFEGLGTTTASNLSTKTNAQLIYFNGYSLTPMAYLSGGQAHYSVASAPDPGIYYSLIGCNYLGLRADNSSIRGLYSSTPVLKYQIFSPSNAVITNNRLGSGALAPVTAPGFTGVTSTLYDSVTGIDPLSTAKVAYRMNYLPGESFRPATIGGEAYRKFVAPLYPMLFYSHGGLVVSPATTEVNISPDEMIAESLLIGASHVVADLSILEDSTSTDPGQDMEGVDQDIVPPPTWASEIGAFWNDLMVANEWISNKAIDLV
jgi:hypothetical protein